MALLTVDQAAERLGTTPRFIRRLIAEKRIAYVKLGGWHVRIEDTVVVTKNGCEVLTPTSKEVREL